LRKNWGPVRRPMSRGAKGKEGAEREKQSGKNRVTGKRKGEKGKKVKFEVIQKGCEGYPQRKRIRKRNSRSGRRERKKDVEELEKGCADGEKNETLN